MSYTAEQQSALLHIARASIDHGVAHNQALRVNLQEFSGALTQPRATFVTLNVQRALRGCIGTLEATRPLISDVAHNAFAAAFSDPRFAPVTRAEIKMLEIHISVLTPPEAMTFRSESDLLRQLQPGIDGLILAEGRRRGTFLPAVWESLPDPNDFLRHLKMKAGLPQDYWSQTLQISRYTTDVIE